MFFLFLSCLPYFSGNWEEKRSSSSHARGLSCPPSAETSGQSPRSSSPLRWRQCHFTPDLGTDRGQGSGHCRNPVACGTAAPRSLGLKEQDKQHPSRERRRWLLWATHQLDKLTSACEHQAGKLICSGYRSICLCKSEVATSSGTVARRASRISRAALRPSQWGKGIEKWENAHGNTAGRDSRGRFG